MSSKLLTGKLTFASLPPLDLSVCNKDEIRAYFENSYDLNESLFTCLKDPNSLYKCPDRLRLPLVFYYTHTAVVYMNKLLLAGLLKERVNATFETMFETGVDEMSWDDTENYRMGGSYKWPSVEEIVEYRRNVRNIILKLIVDTPLQLPITMDSPWWGLVMGMEHERIHLETSSVLLRQLPVHLVEKPQHWLYAPRTWESGCKGNKMVHVAGGEVTLGKPKDFPSFGWDNEYGEAKCSVPEFEASQYLITNKEFLQFVQDGGYQQQDLWTKEAWQWVQFRQARHPTFWVCEEGCKGGCGADLASYSPCASRQNNNAVQNGFGDTNGFLHNQPVPYRYRAMFDMIEMPWDWPVDVNYHEAKAFCRWNGPQFRLPAEAEHHLMRGPQLPVAMGTKSDIIYQEKSEANINLQYGSSTPVNMFAPTETGFSDVFGNVWEWTEDHFNGLDSFNTHFLYDDFSSPCFDGKHNVILGGSWVSTGSEASRFARYAFRRHFFQHLGFRVARSMPQGSKMPMRLVNTEVFVLGSGLLDNTPMFDTDTISLVPSTNLHYCYDAATPPHGILELEFGFRDSLPAATATFATNVMRGCNIPMTSAMYVGSATGRGPFELSKYFDQVLGVEVCSRLIDTALRLQTGNALAYGEGLEATLNADMKPERVVFKQLTWLPNEVNSHNLVIMSHLERVQNPKAWLVRLQEVISHNGLAVVVSADGVWDKDALHEHLHHRLHCVDAQQLAYSSPAGKGTAAVTVWRHKLHCVDAQQLAYSSPAGKGTAAVTVWRHKLHCVDAQQLAYSSPAGKGTAAVTVWRHK